jgi:hypothetical protein
MTTVHEITSGVCPHCKLVLDRHLNALDDSYVPCPGTVTLCAGCSSVLVFDEHMQLREITAEELATAPGHMLQLMREMFDYLKRIRDEEGK